MSAGPGRVHVVMPEGVDDPQRPSGGNAYDRHVCNGLAGSGWTVHQHEAPGSWPDPAPADLELLDDALGAVPTGSSVLVDGLVASAAPAVVCSHCTRLRVIVLVHLPLGVTAPSRRAVEAALLAGVSAVVTTSAWCSSWLAEHYGPAGLDPRRVSVAVPGTEPAAAALGTGTGGALLCVGAVTPVKGHDVLLDALTRLADLDWSMTWVGALDRDRLFVGRLREQADAAGLSGRLTMTGPLTGGELDAAYRAADVLVLPSRAETYGMVVTEALARGLPVIASATGGITEAMGRAPDGAVPGLLSAPADAPALAAALRTWLGDPTERTRARRAAAERRPLLPPWSDTVAGVAEVLTRARMTRG